VLALLAIFFWLPLIRMRKEEKSPSEEPDKTISIPIYRSAIAWYVTIFMGLQAILFYSFVAWMPMILQSKGLTPEMAGYYTSIHQLVCIPVSFVVPLLAGRMRNQRPLVGGIMALYTVGLALLLLSRSYTFVLLAVILCGACMSACFSLYVCLISLRSENASQAARLSSMTQLGYVLPAVFPPLIGAFYDRFAPGHCRSCSSCLSLSCCSPWGEGRKRQTIFQGYQGKTAKKRVSGPPRNTTRTCLYRLTVFDIERPVPLNKRFFLLSKSKSLLTKISACYILCILTGLSLPALLINDKVRDNNKN
jgi:MFS family permease